MKYVDANLMKDEVVTYRAGLDRALLKLAQAERSGDPEALQTAYEEVFVLCYQKHLDLPAALLEAEACQPLKVA